MSVIVAVKKNNHIYMGCDSQTTCGSRYFAQSDSFKKIVKINDVLIGFVGEQELSQELITKYRRIIKKGDYIDKNYIVNHLYLPIKSVISGDGNSNDSNTCAFIIAQDDRMYYVSDDEIIAGASFLSTGSGMYNCYAYLIDHELYDESNINDLLLESLRSTQKFHLYVDKPYFLIDTANFKFKKVEE